MWRWYNLWMLNNNKKALIWGGVFGFVAPFIGMFVGLQIFPNVANVLMFPILGLSMILGTPFGMWGMGTKLAALVLSVVVWALVFETLGRLFKRS